MKKEVEYRIKKETFEKYLRWVYNAINEELFDGELPEIPIRVQRLDDDCRAALRIWSCVDSHCIGDKCHTYGVEYISIEFDSDMAYFNDITEFHIRSIDAMFLEMIREYNHLHGASDVTDATAYHNSGLLATIEEHDGICDSYHDAYGYYGHLQEDALLRIMDQVEEKMVKAWSQPDNEIA